MKHESKEIGTGVLICCPLVVRVKLRFSIDRLKRTSSKQQIRIQSVPEKKSLHRYKD